MEQSPEPSETLTQTERQSQGDSDCESAVASASCSLPARKKTKRDSKWQDGWKKYHMKPSRRGVSFAHCMVCSIDLSIASGGVHELKRHIATKRHSDLAKHFESASQTRITAVSLRKDTLADQVTAAEIYFSTFLVEHNIPFLAADHFNKLCKVMFLIAKLPTVLLQPEQKTLL